MRTCYEAIENPAAHCPIEAIHATFFDDVDQRYGKPIDIADPVRPFATDEHPVPTGQPTPSMLKQGLPQTNEQPYPTVDRVADSNRKAL
jgi:hypothetical protein